MMFFYFLCEFLFFYFNGILAARCKKREKDARKRKCRKRLFFHEILFVYFVRKQKSAHGIRIFNHPNFMEQLNRIELKGNVGNVRLSNVGDSLVAKFSLATNFMYKGREGDAVVETTWHNIVAWNGRSMPDLRKIEKGMPLYVCGRLRSSKYTAQDGSEKQIYEVVANKIAFEEPSPIQCGGVS